MLEQYFVRPATVDRIRDSWIGDSIEQYVVWLHEQDYARRSVHQRVPRLLDFGDFAHAQGATVLDELPEYVEPYLTAWLKAHNKLTAADEIRSCAARSIRGPIYQFLRVILPGYQGGIRGHGLPRPFHICVPEFFSYLVDERGLSSQTLIQYDCHLRCFEDYLDAIGINALSDLSPTILSSYVTHRSQSLAKRSIQRFCSILKIFLQYLHREGISQHDLSAWIELPRQYRHSDIPRSITWDEVAHLLESVDRRSPVGKRDYAVLLMLVTYGLRAREIAAMRLDHIDWRYERLYVPERKAGHSTAFPLSPIVGKAVIDYLQSGRPTSSDRILFLRCMAPYTAVTHGAVSQIAKRAIRKAGIKVLHPGSHTLRHTCVQRMVDAHISLKTIGDYMGHRTSVATEVYAKIDIEALREVAMGDGEAVL
jgi:site-specific recombinase XerD